MNEIRYMNSTGLKIYIEFSQLNNEILSLVFFYEVKICAYRMLIKIYFPFRVRHLSRVIIQYTK